MECKYCTLILKYNGLDDVYYVPNVDSSVFVTCPDAPYPYYHVPVNPLSDPMRETVKKMLNHGIYRGASIRSRD
jgi:hypothetical protein